MRAHPPQPPQRRAAATALRARAALPPRPGPHSAPLPAATDRARHTAPSVNRQGAVEPFTLVEGPEAWYAKDYRGKSDWVTELTPTHIAELDAAIQVRMLTP
jgi:hypothetical protein